jgi:hypothetical protein
LRLKEVARKGTKTSKRVSKSFEKALQATLGRLRLETEQSLSDDAKALDVIETLVKRWILLIRFALISSPLTDSVVNNERVARDFVEIICQIGSYYDCFCPHGENSTISIRCAELQFRFLMSSDLYENDSLVSTCGTTSVLIVAFLINVLEQGLSVPTSTKVNRNLESYDDKSTLSHGVKWEQLRCHNAVVILSRLPLESIPLRQSRQIFNKLMHLDQEVVSRSDHLSLEKPQMIEFLVTIRRALIRFIKTVKRSVLEV